MFRYWITKFKVYFSVTYFLIIINIFFFLLTFVLSGILGGNDYISILFLGGQVLPGSAYPFSAMVFQVWRFVTSSFLHANIIHIGMNMFVLFSVGMLIERFYSGRKLFLTYIFTAITASLLSFIIAFLGYWQSNTPNEGLTLSVGASGAIFGLVGLLIGNKWKNKTYAMEMQINYNSLIIFVLFNLLLGFGINLTGGSFIAVNNWAHLGGLIGGIILGLILDTHNTFDVSKAKKAFEKFLFILSVLIFIFAQIASIIYLIINFFGI